jgi:hypothetical protein
MPWSKITLTAEEVSAGKAKKLHEEFRELFEANGEPLAAAVFWDPSHNVYYFSPGACRIAQGLIADYSGGSCPTPSPPSIELLISRDEWRELWASAA